MTPAEKLASLPATDAPSSVEPVAEAGPFVINLCSSSTPMALPQADLPELKRFTFFVSRRFEEGRERFRLHMGFFATQAEADNWLNLVRDIYPGAWAGEAPGKKLRARAVAAAEVQAAHATGPHSLAPQVEPPAAATPPPTAARAPADAVRPVPTLRPAAAGSVKPAPVRNASEQPVAPKPARPAAQAPSAAVKKPGASSPSNLKEVNSNIKAVLASLDEPVTRQTRVLPASPDAPLSDPQALQCLEGRLPESVKAAAYAVQLKWSVQPIVFEKLPPLAIFSAYMLYCVEGSREGRKWFGLRLGFFNDPISAKQVASYVRSEFASAAVVPVSVDERQRVSGETGPVLPPARKAPEPTHDEFKLFDADAPAPREPAAPPETHQAPKAAKSTKAPKPKAPVHELRPASSARRAAHGNKVHARERRAPQTLEETLEILGANQLTIEDRRDAADNARGIGQSRKVEKSTPFTRLLERLGERVRKS